MLNMICHRIEHVHHLRHAATYANDLVCGTPCVTDEGSVTEATRPSTHCLAIVPYVKSHIQDGASRTRRVPRLGIRKRRAPAVAINNATTSTAIVLYAPPSPPTCTDIVLYGDGSTTTRSMQLTGISTRMGRRSEGPHHALTANNNYEKDMGASRIRCRAFMSYTGVFYAHMDLVLIFDGPGDTMKNVDDKAEDESSFGPDHATTVGNNDEKGIGVSPTVCKAVIRYTGHYCAHIDIVFRREGPTGAMSNMDDKEREIQRLKAELGTERRGRRSVESQHRKLSSRQSELKAAKDKTETQACVVIAVLCALVMTLVKKAKADHEAMMKKVKLALTLSDFHKARLQREVNVAVKTANEQHTIVVEKEAWIDRLNKELEMANGRIHGLTKDNVAMCVKNKRLGQAKSLLTGLSKIMRLHVDTSVKAANEQRTIVAQKDALISMLNKELEIANGSIRGLTNDNLALRGENKRLGQANRRLGQAKSLLTGLSKMMRLQLSQTVATVVHYSKKMEAEVEELRRIARIERTSANDMTAMAEDAATKLKASQRQVQELQLKGSYGDQNVTEANKRIAQLQAVVNKSAEDLVEARRTIAELEQQLGAQQLKTARWKGAAHHEYMRVGMVEEEMKAKLKVLRTATVGYIEAQGAEGVAAHIMDQRMGELTTQLRLTEDELITKVDYVRGCALYDRNGNMCSGWVPHWSMAVPVTVTDERADELADAECELTLCNKEIIKYKEIRDEVKDKRKKMYEAAIDTSKGRTP